MALTTPQLTFPCAAYTTFKTKTHSNDWHDSIFAFSCQKENMALIEVYICVVLHACKTDVT